MTLGVLPGIRAVHSTSSIRSSRAVCNAPVLLCCAAPSAGAFTSYMSSLARCPNHLPTLMAVAGLYKARGMLDEARAALQSALQAAEAAAAAASSGSSSGSNGSGSGASTSSSLDAAAAAAADGALGIGVDSVTLGDSSRPGQVQLQLQEQPSSDDSILSDMSTSSGSNDGSSNGQAGAAGAVSAPAGSTQQAAASVPLASVKEALAVVLTDLGTRAKNAGVC